MSHTFSGGCSCGALRYESVAEPLVAGHCQCRHCQRASGAGHASIIGVHQDALTITGEVKYFDYTADSGNTASNGFCPNCGSNVLGKTSGMPGIMAIKVGSLDDPSWFKPGMTIFTVSAQPWDLVDPDLPAFPGMPER